MASRQFYWLLGCALIAVEASVACLSLPSQRSTSSTDSPKIKAPSSCSPIDRSALTDAVAAFVDAWNQRDIEAIHKLLASGGWIALSPAPGAPAAIMRGTAIDDALRVHWAKRETIAYEGISTPTPGSADGLVTQLTGLVLIDSDQKRHSVTFNKFVRWCSAGGLGQIVLEY